ncbi:MAG TPA: M56 family metallopeptidase, partial [Planctomycetaceae bacterium]|nr:M56 family metallopeptidase [Planctomycetaceae bacterium]
MIFHADRIIDLSWTHVWQVALLAAAVLVVASLVKRRHPHLVYLLWMLVLLKSVTPPLWFSPTAVFGRLASSVESSTSGTTIESAADWAEPLRDAAAAVPSGTSSAALSSTASKISPSLLLVALWVSGSVLLFAFFILKHWRYCRSLMRDSLSDDRLQTLTERLARTLGLKKTPRLLLSSSDCGPSALGVLRPTLV